MKSALVIGDGQIGREIASQLSAAGIRTSVATRSTPLPAPVEVGAGKIHTTQASGSAADRTSTAAPRTPGPVSPPRTEVARVRADAADPAQLLEAAAGTDIIFACVHAPYDSRVWGQVLPPLEKTIMDVGAKLGIPVIFPESVYAFAGLTTSVSESSPFAPVEEKGRIRQQLMQARSAHGARTASVIAGDLVGETAQPNSSVVKMCISDRIGQGRRAIVPARTDVPHGITVIADLAAAMIGAARSLEADNAAEHRLFLAPASNPTLADIAAFTYSYLGIPARRPIALPRWTTRVAGLVERSMFELHELSPIWYQPCIIETGELADEVGTTRWQDGIIAMLL
ncbi:hypothetical protein [Brevibacterium sp.]|uniref:hypothetical protein n=1 Tax=Brevibacterium sp. TaxID=1701 RepID=UPI00264810BB|nr:hypothetical protein [Brevibacterium sp.]MDN6133989.1 hypothetical protein [Brevibacterium sp.]MDN6604778.1 hypothetical protein [Brevibacterium sp.]